MFGRDVTCNVCGRTERIRSAEIYHCLFSNHQIFPSCSAPSWCFDCDGIRGVEQLPPLEYLRSRLAELEANGIDEAKLQEKAVFLRMVFDPRAELQKELDKAQAAILWRTERRSPPRCLECGGTHHRAIDPYGNEIDHPGCEGTFQIKLEYHASQSSYRQLDSEGTSLSKK